MVAGSRTNSRRSSEKGLPVTSSSRSCRMVYPPPEYLHRLPGMVSTRTASVFAVGQAGQGRRDQKEEAVGQADRYEQEEEEEVDVAGLFLPRWVLQVVKEWVKPYGSFY